MAIQAPTLGKKSAIALWAQGRDAWNDWVSKNHLAAVSFESADFSSHIDEGGLVSFAGYRFPKGGVRFDLANFGKGNVNFEDAYFSECTVSFQGAQFGTGAVSFNGTSFTQGGLSFKEAKFGGGSVSFVLTSFPHGSVSFENATFGDGNVSFAHSEFAEGDVNFEGATFGNGRVSFAATAFSDGFVSFKDATFGNSDVDFAGAAFGRGSVLFSSAKFGKGRIDFSGVEFGSGDVIFTKADFGDGTVAFDSSTFGNGSKYFWFTTFGKGAVRFPGVNFGDGIVTFSKAEFGDGDVLFGGAKFGTGNISFDGTKFGNGAVSFRAVTSHGNFYFTPAHTSIPTSPTQLLFDRSRFHEIVVIEGHYFCIPDFRSTITQGHVDLQNLHVKPWTPNWKAPAERYSMDPDNHVPALRRLKELAEANRHHDAALRFFADERRAMRWAHLGAGASILEWAYDLLSLYGQSIGRPTIGLIVSALIFARLLFDLATEPQRDSVWTFGEALFVSIANTVPFLPPALMARSDAMKNLFGPDPGFWVDILTVTQGAIGFTFLFLIGLGLRNRFRM